MNTDRALIILLFHGSRHHQSAQEAAELARRFSEKSGAPVSIAFLQMAAPLLTEVLEAALVEGKDRIRVFPLFTLTGAHVANDIPKVISDFRTRFPDRTIELEPHLAADGSFQEWLFGRIFPSSVTHSHG